MAPFVSTIAAAALLLSLGSPAHITETPAEVEFGQEYLLDSAGVLGSDIAGLQRVVDDLYDKTQIELFIAYVDTFELPDDADRWGEIVLADNFIPSKGILFAIAVEARDFTVSYPDYSALGLSEQQLDDVFQDRVLPQLKQDAWAEAGKQFAYGIARELGHTLTGDSAAGSGWGTLWFLLGTTGVIGGIVYFFRRKRTQNHDAVAPGKLTLKELEGRIGSSLVELDDALKLSEEELGFAEAQFGKAAVTEFHSVLKDAEQKIRQAFTIKQQLDDDIPDTDAQRRAWSMDILALTEAAQQGLEGQQESFEQLRKLDQEFDTIFHQVKSTLAGLGTEITSARERYRKLSDQYSQTALESIASNADQIEALTAFAAFAVEQILEAETRREASDNSEAVLALRGAQQSIGQVQTLIEQVATTEEALGSASQQFQQARTELQGALTEAQRFQHSTQEAGTALAPLIAAGQQLIAELSGKDPLAEITRIEQLDTQLDAALAASRSQAEQQQRAQQALTYALSTAENRINSARDFITLRRGGVGVTARTRLADAERRLVEARSLAATNPQAALAEAQNARQLAESALSIANSEVNSYSGGNYQQSAGPDLGGILGSFLGAMLGSGMGSGSTSSRPWSSGSSSNRGSSSGWGSGSSRPSGGGRSSGGIFGGGSSRGSRGNSSRSGGFSGSFGKSRGKGGKF